MRKLLLLLGVLCCCATTAALAGPNAGGVLWVHDTGINVSSDPVGTWPPAPANCAGVDNNAPVILDLTLPPVSRYWKVYAAFPTGSSPRLKTTGWRTQFDNATGSAYSYVNMTASACKAPDEDGPGTDFWIGDLGFPTESGGQIGQSFPTGPRLGLVTTLFIFGGYGYNAGGAYAPPTWATVQHSAPGNRVFGDDAIPTNEDPITGYSSMGFGAAGTTVCPVPPTGACCNFATGACTITSAAIARSRGSAPARCATSRTARCPIRRVLAATSPRAPARLRSSPRARSRGLVPARCATRRPAGAAADGCLLQHRHGCLHDHDADRVRVHVARPRYGVQRSDLPGAAAGGFLLRA